MFTKKNKVVFPNDTNYITNVFFFFTKTGLGQFTADYYIHLKFMTVKQKELELLGSYSYQTCSRIICYPCFLLARENSSVFGNGSARVTSRAWL